jgi:hypothetical protein
VTVNFWRQSYCISELGPAHDDYGNPDVVQREVVKGAWIVKGDARRELKPAVVRWYDAEVDAIDRAQVAAPGAQEIADQLLLFTLCHNEPATPRFHVRCDVREFGDIEASGDTMTEALAALLLKLKRFRNERYTLAGWPNYWKMRTYKHKQEISSEQNQNQQSAVN